MDFVASKLRYDSHPIITTGYRISYSSSTTCLEALVIWSFRNNSTAVSIEREDILTLHRPPSAGCPWSIVRDLIMCGSYIRTATWTGTVVAFDPLSLSSSPHRHPCLIRVPTWCFFFRSIVCLSSCRPFAFGLTNVQRHTHIFSSRLPSPTSGRFDAYYIIPASFTLT